MPLTYRYVPMHKGDNEWLADPKNCNEEGWDEAWDLLIIVTGKQIGRAHV